MTEIETLRHSCAHVLATAILRIWPEAQFAAGPPVENGFYYDVELPHRISPEDFAKIEEEMKKEIKANHVFERVDGLARARRWRWPKRASSAALASGRQPSKFKLDIIAEHSRGRRNLALSQRRLHSISAPGPHVMRTGNIGAFKLTHVASAYYKGDEKNPQLQRIYGTAFKNKTELDEYFTMLEEAKKRDHRKLGKETGALLPSTTTSAPACRSGCPRGTVMIEELEKLAKETEFAAGYRARPHAAPRAGEHVSDQRASALLRGVDVSADGATGTKEDTAAKSRRFGERVAETDDESANCQER